MDSAEFEDIFVSVFADVEIEQIVPHAQFLAKRDDSFIEIVHFEQSKKVIAVILFVLSD